ncbi:MAG: Fe(3+) ABC transporter substrate-binding protein [Cellvibrionaceae bacterium]|nr:Fe(3+) ABC transporter substrate-binding protein [Cellvibrionaceae bacterium]
MHTVIRIATLLIASMMAAGTLQAAEAVNVYSARKSALIEPLLERFTQETGIQVNLVTGKDDALIKRLQVEGKASPADILITVDAGRLHRAKSLGLLRSVDNSTLHQTIPAYLRDTDDQWFGISLRARPIFYVKDKVNPETLSSYEALADAQWKNKVCIRSSNNIYNQSLVSSMISAKGVEDTEQWAQAFVNNFARQPTGGDTDQLRAAAAGVCDIAIANTYYYGRLLKSSKPEDRAVAAKLGIFWPNQNDRGTHVNVSGIGVTQSAKNYDNAIKLIEFLVTPASQSWYAEINNEYPVVDNANTDKVLASLGSFKKDVVNLTELGINNRTAVELMDRAKWR